MIATGALVLAAGAGSSALLIPRSDAAGAARAELERAQSQVGQLRAQLATERRAHRLAVAKLRGHAAVAGPAHVDHALRVAASTYGVPLARLRRVAACESTLDPNATNGHYAGLFQFGAPLWRATPYATFSRTDPYAAALAAAWAFKGGMAGHWPVCGRR
jgi:hypothetical protein